MASDVLQILRTPAGLKGELIIVVDTITLTDVAVAVAVAVTFRASIETASRIGLFITTKMGSGRTGELS